MHELYTLLIGGISLFISVSRLAMHIGHNVEVKEAIRWGMLEESDERGRWS